MCCEPRTDATRNELVRRIRFGQTCETHRQLDDESYAKRGFRAEGTQELLRTKDLNSNGMVY